MASEIVLGRTQRGEGFGGVCPAPAIAQVRLLGAQLEHLQQVIAGGGHVPTVDTLPEEVRSLAGTYLFLISLQRH